MADGELLDAREAMSLLGINENDLQSLVARGDLRAFRSAGTMKFRRDDVVALKSEKGTEPTIIIPAASSVRKGQEASGILPTVASPAATQASRPGSRVGPAAKAPGASRIAAPVSSGSSADNATGEIVLDDIELQLPGNDAGITQNVTVQGTAISDNTVLEPQTAQMTVIEDVNAATGPASAVTGSRVQPAMSRVSRAVGSAPGAVSMATSRRTQAAYQVKSAHWIFTAVLILTSVVFLFAGSVAGVMLSRGSYDKDSGERIIPPFLTEGSQFCVYRWCYDKTPGDPQDPKPNGEYAGGK